MTTSAQFPAETSKDGAFVRQGDATDEVMIVSTLVIGVGSTTYPVMMVHPVQHGIGCVAVQAWLAERRAARSSGSVKLTPNRRYAKR